MAYNGPVYQAREQDLAPQLIAQGWQGLGAGISRGIGDLATGMEKRADKKEMEAAANSKFDVWLSKRPDIAGEFAEKFYGGSLGSKTGLLHELETLAGRDDRLATEAEGARRFDLKYNQDTIQNANTANYQTGMLANQKARLDADARPVNWKPLPNSDYLASDSGAVVPMSRPAASLRAVTEPTTGATVYELGGQPVDPNNILVQEQGIDPVTGSAGGQQSAPDPSLVPFSGPGSWHPPMAPQPSAAPAQPKPARLVPLRQPAGKAAPEGIRQTQEGTFFSRGGKTFKLWSPDEEGFAAGQRPEWVEIPVPDPAAIPKPAPGMSAAPAAQPVKSTLSGWMSKFK